MLDLKATAEVRGINVRAEMHNEDIQPAFDVKLMLIAVDVKALSAFCPNMDKHFYDAEGLVTVGEVSPLTVTHKIENITASIGSFSHIGCDIKKGAKITLLPEWRANVEVQVQCQSGDVNTVLKHLRDEVKVTLTERQLDMVSNG